MKALIRKHRRKGCDDLAEHPAGNGEAARCCGPDRDLQIAGIYVCLTGNRELVDCACLKDVLKVEGKERLKKPVEDWKSVPRRMSDVAGEV
ncbi:hypothetical protein EJC51_13305 [Streptomyces aquilus]|uniref:Uncharacterized protein n=1 Tax=Streptomyces aquilus TaxID=2548456 RepID=A0A3S9HY41_9ACTN|nr:hypothetical protein [Streptomyces aquilus]AZP17008.1 hypothetical protein EJC51_13305 [Streptomyces aquilus]